MNESIDSSMIINFLILPTAVGYILFRVGLYLLPGRLKASNLNQKTEVLKDARVQASTVCEDLLKRNAANIQILRDDLAESIEERKVDLQSAEEETTVREGLFESESERISKLDATIQSSQRKVQSLRDINANLEKSKANLQTQLKQRLEEVSKSDSQEIKSALIKSLLEGRQLECQKVLRLLNEDLNTTAKRSANKIIGRALARYTPEFPWPKMLNHIEISDPKIADQIETMPDILEAARELATIDIELGRPDNPEFPSMIRLSGGAGIDREAARLALDEIFSMHSAKTWSKIPEFFRKHREQLEQQAIDLGRQATVALHLDDIHPEIQKLVGYLNWRTSYRQNQYLHSFEVAVLAGIVASELGVNPADAKRCGLLHDIGKALDYRIEGSHAVISGDYADRYGERRMICDTVMSHHNDLNIETPMAYVLKTADTLSGGRPGARVNLEEGYQIRLNAIDEVIRSFPGVTKSAIMNGGREVHVEVSHKRIKDAELQALSTDIAKRIEADVAFPGQIKVLVTRRFEATSVA